MAKHSGEQTGNFISILWWYNRFKYYNHYCRIGCLPYSQHARAKVSVLADGSVEYYDWWGYEITMVEVLAAKHNFTWGYFPPADGLWGALEDSGNMSGLIGPEWSPALDCTDNYSSQIKVVSLWSKGAGY